MVGSAAVCQLPTMILIDMKKNEQFYHNTFNRWWNSMTVLADNDIYPELIGGEAWYGKICDTLGEWFLSPDVRWTMAQQWEYMIKDALSYRSLDRK